MNCVEIDFYLILAFGGCIFLANFSHWRMKKNLTVKEEKMDHEMTVWQKIISDISFPSNFLTDRGILWKRLSVIFFAGICISGIAFPVLNAQDWVCPLKFYPK